MSLQVITANALLEGDVVYLSAEGNWSLNLHEAMVFSEPKAAQAALATAEARSDEVVSVYLAGVTLKDGVPSPKHFREAFRQSGPSNKFHGKQADLSEQSDVSL